MVYTIFTCFCCKLVKTNTQTGSRSSADFHWLSTKQFSFKNSWEKLFPRSHPFQNQSKKNEGKNIESLGTSLRVKL